MTFAVWYVFVDYAIQLKFICVMCVCVRDTDIVATIRPIIDDVRFLQLTDCYFPPNKWTKFKHVIIFFTFCFSLLQINK